MFVSFGHLDEMDPRRVSERLRHAAWRSWGAATYSGKAGPAERRAAIIRDLDALEAGIVDAHPELSSTAKLFASIARQLVQAGVCDTGYVPKIAEHSYLADILGVLSGMVRGRPAPAHWDPHADLNYTTLFGRRG